MKAVEHAVDLACDLERAFMVFTTRVDGWWPPSHRRSDGRLHLDGFVGGRLVETTPAGERVFGEVLVWEPPRRVVLAWWPGAADGVPTRAEIRFEPQGDRTRVSVRHTDGERPHPDDSPAIALFRRGWEAVLSAFAGATLRGSEGPWQT